MMNSIKMAALAAAVTFTGMGYSAPSIAQDVEFLIGPDGLKVRQRDYCERNRDDRRCRDFFSRGRGDDGGERRDRRRGGCDSGDAVEKAMDMGVRRARVVDQGRRSIEVAGVGRRGRVVITFGRDRGCPVLDREYM